MSYCRWGEESDVYCYRAGTSTQDVWMIHVSTVADPTVETSGDYTTYSQEECLERLLMLRKSGLLVPEHAIARLKKEIAPSANNQPIP